MARYFHLRHSGELSAKAKVLLKVVTSGSNISKNIFNVWWNTRTKNYVWPLDTIFKIMKIQLLSVPQAWQMKRPRRKGPNVKIIYNFLSMLQTKNFFFQLGLHLHFADFVFFSPENINNYNKYRFCCCGSILIFSKKESL